jgi:hypothetical protein
VCVCVRVRVRVCVCVCARARARACLCDVAQLTRRQVPYAFNDGWTKWLAEKEGWNRSRAWEPWAFSGQTAGYVTTYTGPRLKSNLTFATVKGAGHMVPSFFRSRFGFCRPSVAVSHSHNQHALPN